MDVLNPSLIDPRLDSRAITFENPTGARGAGGTAEKGRKGSPARLFEPGERVVLADIAGPGTIRHLWMALSWDEPAEMRAVRLEVFYDDLAEPSISVPIMDFFGAPHGRAVPVTSALASIQEGRGFNSHVPMPFGRAIRVELTNESTHGTYVYFQLDYTLEPFRPGNDSYLHATFRRENPTTVGRDFVVTDGFRGPGRFLGCVVGLRTLDPTGWYGEGEVKIYRDGDRDLPTICGTGLEDYVGSAYGMGRHLAHFAGVPLDLRPADPAEPSYVAFYRWHLPDPIMFADELTVTIQQLGGSPHFVRGQEEALERYLALRPAAGSGWYAPTDGESESLGGGLVERVDDYCATAFVYCREPQAVPRYATELAIADLDLTPLDGPVTPFDLEAEDRTNRAMAAAWERRFAGAARAS